MVVEGRKGGAIQPEHPLPSMMTWSMQRIAYWLENLMRKVSDVNSKDSKDASSLTVIANSEGNLSQPCPKGNADMGRSRIQNIPKGGFCQHQPSSNLSTVHPVRPLEEDGNGYDSGHDNGSTSSFEFHRGERALQHPAVGPFFRHIPSKWNDAEKWILNRQMMPSPNLLKRSVMQNQGSRQVISGSVRVAPESIAAEHKHSIIQAVDAQRISCINPATQNVVEKFSFAPNCLQSSLDTANSGDYGLKKELDHKKLSVPESSVTSTSVIPAVQSVSMRDVGTEMTPIPSQEPSRTGTPIGATTPTCSPLSSIPSTPKRAAPTSSETTVDEHNQKKVGKKELSERELKLKTRREIAALGIQLGKMNIASWASKDDAKQGSPSLKTLDVDQLVKTEYETRAAAWEESQKSKHMARYRRKEVKIQEWESYQKAKFEAKMRKVEAQVERMKARAQERMQEKLAETRRLVEEKQATAEARRNREAARTARQVEQIRQTGHMPSRFRCCSWLL
ncbi:uncharacterized protein [Elaeis guineensis]|uniref:uncharacterized protein isoform X2 n=1 Tax=Elaeis guineensis var. tenera TaxID=51953 RepID=UPI00094FA844